MQRNSLFPAGSAIGNKTARDFDTFIQWMNKVGSFKEIAEHDIKSHFAENFEYSTNDKVTATNSQQLLELLQMARTKFKKAFIHFPLKDLQMSEGEVKASYKVTFVDVNDKQREDINTIHVVFNEEGKASKFQQNYTMQPPMKDVQAVASLKLSC